MKHIVVCGHYHSVFLTCAFSAMMMLVGQQEEEGIRRVKYPVAVIPQLIFLFGECSLTLNYFGKIDELNVILFRDCSESSFCCVPLCWPLWTN